MPKISVEAGCRELKGAVSLITDEGKVTGYFAVQ